jgi:hypothetical protein
MGLCGAMGVPLQEIGDVEDRRQLELNPPFNGLFEYALAGRLIDS